MPPDSCGAFKHAAFVRGPTEGTGTRAGHNDGRVYAKRKAGAPQAGTPAEGVYVVAQNVAKLSGWMIPGHGGRAKAHYMLGTDSLCAVWVMFTFEPVEYVTVSDKKKGIYVLNSRGREKGVVNAFAANNRRVGEGREVSIISRISHASRDLWL